MYQMQLQLDVLCFSYTTCIKDCWYVVRFLHGLCLVAFNITLLYVFNTASQISNDDNVFRIRFNITTYLEKGIQPALSSYKQFLDDHCMGQVWFLMRKLLGSMYYSPPHKYCCFLEESEIEWLKDVTYILYRKLE